MTSATKVMTFSELEKKKILNFSKVLEFHVFSLHVFLESNFPFISLRGYPGNTLENNTA